MPLFNKEFYSKEICGMGEKPTMCYICRKTCKDGNKWRRKYASLFIVNLGGEDWECPRKDRPWGYIPEELRTPKHIREIGNSHGDSQISIPDSQKASSISENIDMVFESISNYQSKNQEYFRIRDIGLASMDSEVVDLIGKIDISIKLKSCDCTINPLKNKLISIMKSKKMI